MKNYCILIIILIITTNIAAVSKGPDFSRTIGTTKADCHSLETDIKALEKKQKKSAKDTEHLNAQKYNFEKAQCTEKLKAKK